MVDSNESLRLHGKYGISQENADFVQRYLKQQAGKGMSVPSPDDFIEGMQNLHNSPSADEAVTKFRQAEESKKLTIPGLPGPLPYCPIPKKEMDGPAMC